MLDEKESYVPLDCPMCELIMRDISDCARYQVSGCCVECWIGFLEPLRKQTCDDEYLPNVAELENYRKKIRDIETEKKNA